MQDKFFRKLLRKIGQYEGSLKNNRKYVPILKSILPEFEEHLPKPLLKFLRIGIIAGFDSEARKQYTKTSAYARWHFYFIDSLWGAHCRHCRSPLTNLPLFSKPEHIYCSNKCAQLSPEVAASRKSAFMTNYGVDHPSRAEAVKQKICKTMLDRHGGYTLASSSLKKKVDATNVARYGSKHVTQNPEVIKKSLETQQRKFGGVGMGSELLRAKASATYAKRTGLSHQFKDASVVAKATATIHARYGVDHPMQSLVVRERVRQTNLDRYGVSNPAALPATRAKARATMRKRYGVDYPMQNPVSREKQQRAAFKINSYLIDGRIFELQSKAEFLVATKLVAKYGVDKVHSQFHEQFPAYVFSECGTFPDLYVDTTDTFVEVKSDWTFFGRRGSHLRALTEGSLSNNRRKARTANVSNTVRWVIVSGSRIHVLPKDWFDTMTSKQLRTLITPAA